VQPQLDSRKRTLPFRIPDKTCFYKMYSMTAIFFVAFAFQM